MNIKYTEIKNLPPLAWLADIQEKKIHVFHGSAVECKEKSFVEGAWNGNFSDIAFMKADWFRAELSKMPG